MSAAGQKIGTQKKLPVSAFDAVTREWLRILREDHPDFVWVPDKGEDGRK